MSRLAALIAASHAASHTEVDMSKQLCQTECERLQQQLKSLLDKEDISPRIAAAILGCSESTISQIRRGKYSESGGDVEKYLRRLKQWLLDREHASSMRDIEYIDTHVGRRIRGVCARAWQEPSMGMISLESGSGKTAALLEVRRLRGHWAAYVRINRACATQRGLLEGLANAMGMGDLVINRASVGKIYSSIADKLRRMYADGRGASYLLLIDEATKLGPKGLEILKDFHDECHCGIVISDTAKIHREIESSGAAIGGYEQIRSRMSAVYAPSRQAAPNKKDVEAISNAVLAALGHKKQLPAESLDYLVDLAAAPGRFRNPVNRLRGVYQLAKALQIAPTFCVEELQMAAPALGDETVRATSQMPFGQRKRRAVG